jgi:tetratricopeptide (TPR) repeat protein
VKKTAQMQNLLSRGKASEVIFQFANEELSKWPFWKRGDGYHLRGRAYFITNDGPKAEADLTKALVWVSEPHSRDSLLLTLAQNRERNLRDDDRALEAFNAIISDSDRIGSADDYSALQGISRIQTRRGQYDQALRTLKRANLDKLQGTWRENILRSIEAVDEARRDDTK